MTPARGVSVPAPADTGRTAVGIGTTRTHYEAALTELLAEQAAVVPAVSAVPSSLQSAA